MFTMTKEHSVTTITVFWDYVVVDQSRNLFEKLCFYKSAVRNQPFTYIH